MFPLTSPGPLCAGAVTLVCLLRACAGRCLSPLRGRDVRLLVAPYRGDRATAEEVGRSLAVIHALLYPSAGERLLGVRQSLALEVHLSARADGTPIGWLAVCVPRDTAPQVAAALNGAYPDAAVRENATQLAAGASALRLRKRAPFFRPVRDGAALDTGAEPVERLLRAMSAAGTPSVVRIVTAPAPRVLERVLGERLPEQPERPQREPLFRGEVRVLAPNRVARRSIAAELAAGAGERRMVVCRLPRLGTRGRGPSLFGAGELARLWQLPSVGFDAVPCVRSAVPRAPAPPGICRPRRGGVLADAHGPVTIEPALRRQNTAVVGTVEQGKSSYLVASARADLERPDCAVIVLDPKGDAAEAVLGAVPRERRCTVLDMARPTCGFNPLAAAAPIDAIADYVVAALRQLFSEGEVRGSSDRYLRNALVAALACDRGATLWDVARLLAVGPQGEQARRHAVDLLIERPEHAEVAAFLAEELPVQLADARASTTANRVVLLGNLTRDPELRATPGGLSVCRLRLACNHRRRKGESGEWENRANFFDVTVFGAPGEACAQYLAKGAPVAVDGRLEWSEWETAEGARRQNVGVIADSVQFLHARAAGEDGDRQPVAVGVGDDAERDEEGGDIPF